MATATTPRTDEVTVSISEADATLIRYSLSATGIGPDDLLAADLQTFEDAFAKLAAVRAALHEIGWRDEDGASVTWPVDLKMSVDLWDEVIGDQLHLVGEDIHALAPLVDGYHRPTPRALAKARFAHDHLGMVLDLAERVGMVAEQHED